MRKKLTAEFYTNINEISAENFTEYKEKFLSEIEYVEVRFQTYIEESKFSNVKIISVFSEQDYATVINVDFERDLTEKEIQQQIKNKISSDKKKNAKELKERKLLETLKKKYEKT